MSVWKASIWYDKQLTRHGFFQSDFITASLCWYYNGNKNLFKVLYSVKYNFFDNQMASK